MSGRLMGARQPGRRWDEGMLLSHVNAWRCATCMWRSGQGTARVSLSGDLQAALCHPASSLMMMMIELMGSRNALKYVAACSPPIIDILRELVECI